MDQQQPCLNQKFEHRNPKQFFMTEKWRKSETAFLKNSNFGFQISFEIRYSDFEFKDRSTYLGVDPQTLLAFA